MKWHIASVSWGKDSLAMLLMLIAKGYPLNEVVFYDTGMEFEAIYHTRDQMLPRLEQLGIKYTRLEPENPFLFDMLERPVCSKQKGTHQGYGWCGGLCRWGTTGKLKAIDRYAEARDAMVYVGIAADETPRLEKERKPYKLHPLAEWGMTEAASSDAEKERLSGEIEDLRRKLAMSDKDVTAAQLYFYQWQAAFNQLTQAISHIKDEDKAGKLCAAIRAQLAAWGKTMEETP